MKAIKAGLLDQITASYDKDKTTTFGKVFSKVINSNTVLGPSPNKTIDVYTDTLAGGAVIPLYIEVTSNNRMFVFSAITANTSSLGTILYYDFNTSTGDYQYRGRIQYKLPNTAATTHTIRSVAVDDRTSTFKIYVTTTGAILINGGVFSIYGTTEADYVPIGFTTLQPAIVTGQKGVYQLQDPSACGANSVLTTAGGMVVPYQSTDNNVSENIFVHNGTATVHQIYDFDGYVVPTIVSKTCTSPTVNANPTFALTSHGFNLNDPVVITNNCPGGFTTTTELAQTVYFINNPFTHTFELKATVAGASINCTTATSPTILRAFGQSLNSFYLKTGNLPALTGTLLLTNTDCYAKPSHTVNSGSDCFFTATTTNLYIGKISELTSGVTTWSSLVSSNILGNGIDIVVPTATFATFDDTLDMAIYNTQTVMFVMKKIANSQIVGAVGALSNRYMETVVNLAPQFSMTTISGVTSKLGWLFAAGSTAGQRVILATHLGSDQYFNTSAIVSPVFYVGPASLKNLTAFEQQDTDGGFYYIRSADTKEDSLFSTELDGWVAVNSEVDLSATEMKSYVQVKVMFINRGRSPCQLSEILLITNPNNEISDYWEGSVDNTTANGLSPCYTSFRLGQVYKTSVPKMYFRAYDDSNNLVVSANTIDNSSFFQYTTNNGTSWNTLGTIPNTALTTEVRYNWVSPPGVSVVVSFRES